jgi:uncharacterized protein
MRIPLAHLLVKSPLPRIAEQMEHVMNCADKVPELIQALKDGEFERIKVLAKETSMLEGRADDAKNSVRAKMPIRLFLPVDRRDVLRLVSQIDDIADCAEDVGVLLTLRQMEVPEELSTVLTLFVERVMEVVRTSGKLVALIEPLIEASFGGKTAEEAATIIQELARKEHEADKLQDQCAKILFGLEDRLPPMSIFMWTKIFNKIGDMANHAENVGDQFRLFIAR